MIGSQLALWGSRGRLAVAVRQAVAGDLDLVNTYDTAVLFGLRGRHNGTTMVAGIGPAMILDRGGARRESGAGIAAGGEYAFNWRYAGVGVGAFAALGPKPIMRFAGIGFTLELGKIQ
jgi:hypothetical protein